MSPTRKPLRHSAGERPIRVSRTTALQSSTDAQTANQLAPGWNSGVPSLRLSRAAITPYTEETESNTCIPMPSGLRSRPNASPTHHGSQKYASTKLRVQPFCLGRRGSRKDETPVEFGPTTSRLLSRRSAS